MIDDSTTKNTRLLDWEFIPKTEKIMWLLLIDYTNPTIVILILLGRLPAYFIFVQVYCEIFIIDTSSTNQKYGILSTSGNGISIWQTILCYFYCRCYKASHSEHL